MADNVSQVKHPDECCEKKLDRIILEIQMLKKDMSEKYKKLHLQFKLLLLSVGACLGISIHQFIILFFRAA